MEENMKTDGMAVTAMVLGIVGLFIPILGFLLAIAAIILGIVSINKIKKTGMKGKGMAIAGIVIGVIGILWGFIFLSIGALAYFGVMSPAKMLPERTTFQAPIPNTDMAVVSSGGTVAIAFRNNAGQDIMLNGQVSGTQDCPSPSLVSVKKGATVISTADPIANGDSFVVTFDCGSLDKGQFNADLGFGYKAGATGVERMHTGRITATVK